MMYSLVQSHQFRFETILGDAIKRKRILHNCTPFCTIRLCTTTILFLLVLLTIRIIPLYLHVAMILNYVLFSYPYADTMTFQWKRGLYAYLRIWGEFNRDHTNYTIIQYKTVYNSRECMSFFYLCDPKWR